MRVYCQRATPTPSGLLGCHQPSGRAWVALIFQIFNGKSAFLPFSMSQLIHNLYKNLSLLLRKCEGKAPTRDERKTSRRRFSLIGQVLPVLASQKFVR